MPLAMFHTMFHVVLGWDGQRQTIRHNRTMPALRAQFCISAILGTVNRSKKTGTSRIISFSSDAKSILVGMALVLIGGAMWGCNATVSKLLMSNYSVDPLWLACIREFFAGLLFLIAGGIMSPNKLVGAAKDVPSYPKYLALALCCVLVGQVSYLQSINWTNSGTATILQSLNLLVVLAWVCIMSHRMPRKRETIGVALAFIGTVLIATGGNLSTLALPPQGLAWGLANAIATSALSIMPTAMIAKWGNFVTNGIMFLISGLVLCPFVQPWAHLPKFDVASVSMLLFTVVLGTFGAYALFMAGVMRIGSIRATMLGTIEPVLATVTAVLFTGVVFGTADLVGFALIIIMVFLVR